MFQNNASLNQEARIKGIMNYYKNFSQNDNKYSFEIPFIRTELAAFTGLRVETVIRRACKKMELEKIIKMRIEKFTIKLSSFPRSEIIKKFQKRSIYLRNL